DGTGSTQNPFHVYNTPGAYTVILTVTTSDGCTNTITMPNYINVFANPVAEFAAGPQPTTILDPNICFTDQSVNADVWNWSFGDIANSSSTLTSPCFAYSDTGCFDIVLTVTTVNGCVDTVVHPICITPDYTMFIPNTFTPDGNGVNDVFIPKTSGIDLSTFEMWIFDRWGNMIYYTEDLTKGWDGKVQGHDNIAQIDTYVYKIRCKDYLDIKHQYIGHVNLIK
ncbi:MAG: PKD domain-containing protein, partial [Bacteroidetes bacterium]